VVWGGVVSALLHMHGIWVRYLATTSTRTRTRMAAVLRPHSLARCRFSAYRYYYISRPRTSVAQERIREGIQEISYNKTSHQTVTEGS